MLLIESRFASHPAASLRTVKSGEGVPGGVGAGLVLDPLRNRAHLRGAVELADERRRHVHARGHAGGGPPVTVVDPSSPGLPCHRGAEPAGPGEGSLVARRSVAVEQAGRCEQRRAGAHGDDEAGPAPDLREPAEEPHVVDQPARTAAPGHEDDIRLDQILVSAPRHDPAALRARHRPRGGARVVDGDARSQMEHLDGSEDVEQLEPVEEDHRDRARINSSHIGDPTRPRRPRNYALVRRSIQ